MLGREVYPPSSWQLFDFEIASWRFFALRRSRTVGHVANVHQVFFIIEKLSPATVWLRYWLPLRCIEFHLTTGFRANHSLGRVGHGNWIPGSDGSTSKCSGCELVLHKWKVFPISFSSEPSVNVPARDNPPLPSIGGDVCRYAWKLQRSAWQAVTDFCCPLLTSFSSCKSNRRIWITCSNAQFCEHFFEK